MIHYLVKKSLLKLKKYLEVNDKEVFMMEERKIIKTNKSTKFKNLNDYLFEQIENLNGEDVDLEREIPKAKALSQLSQQIINNINTYLKVVKTVKEFEIDDAENLNLLG